MPRYSLVYSRSFKKSLKKLNQNDLKKTKEVLEKLSDGKKLEKKYKNHSLTGNLKEYKECHIKPDLLLIYRYFEDYLELYLYDIGSHSELF